MELQNVATVDDGVEAIINKLYLDKYITSKQCGYYKEANKLGLLSIEQTPIMKIVSGLISDVKVGINIVFKINHEIDYKPNK